MKRGLRYQDEFPFISPSSFSKPSSLLMMMAQRMEERKPLAERAQDFPDSFLYRQVFELISVRAEGERIADKG